VLIEVRHIGSDFDIGRWVETTGVDAWAGDDDHAETGNQVLDERLSRDDFLQERCTDAGAADGDDAHRLLRTVAQVESQLLALTLRGRLESGDVSGKVEVLLGPVPDRGQTRSEGCGDDVVGVADEDGPVSQPLETVDMLDHLGVVVGCDPGFPLTAGLHREPADEVGHPGERAPLVLGILVEEVVEVPGLVGDDEVVVLLLEKGLEDLEVGDKNLVHVADGLEGVKIVFVGLRLDVGRLAGE
jgi:hypothetical protein